MFRSRAAALLVSLALALTARAESYKVNAHIEPGVGTGLNPGFFVSGASIKVDLGLLSIGPVAPQIEAFGLGTHDITHLSSGATFGGAIGLRWRILNDDKGYFFSPGGTPGNLFGNLWLDADLAITTGAPHIGFD